MRTLSLGAACLLLALLAIILSEAAAIGPFGRKKKNGWRQNKDEASSDAPQPVTCDEMMARTIVGISDEKAEIAAQLQAALSELDAANRNISTLKEDLQLHADDLRASREGAVAATAKAAEELRKVRETSEATIQENKSEFMRKLGEMRLEQERSRTEADEQMRDVRETSEASIMAIQSEAQKQVDESHTELQQARAQAAREVQSILKERDEAVRSINEASIAEKEELKAVFSGEIAEMGKRHVQEQERIIEEKNKVIVTLKGSLDELNKSMKRAVMDHDLEIQRTVKETNEQIAQHQQDHELSTAQIQSAHIRALSMLEENGAKEIADLQSHISELVQQSHEVHVNVTNVQRDVVVASKDMVDKIFDITFSMSQWTCDGIATVFRHAILKCQSVYATHVVPISIVAKNQALVMVTRYISEPLSSHPTFKQQVVPFYESTIKVMINKTVDVAYNEFIVPVYESYVTPTRERVSAYLQVHAKWIRDNLNDALDASLLFTHNVSEKMNAVALNGASKGRDWIDSFVSSLYHTLVDITELTFGSIHYFWENHEHDTFAWRQIGRYLVLFRNNAKTIVDVQIRASAFCFFFCMILPRLLEMALFTTKAGTKHAYKLAALPFKIMWFLFVPRLMFQHRAVPIEKDAPAIIAANSTSTNTEAGEMAYDDNDELEDPIRDSELRSKPSEVHGVPKLESKSSDVRSIPELMSEASEVRHDSELKSKTAEILEFNESNNDSVALTHPPEIAIIETGPPENTPGSNIKHNSKAKTNGTRRRRSLRLARKNSE